MSSPRGVRSGPPEVVTSYCDGVLIQACACVRVCVTERALQTDRGLSSETVAELGQMEYQLLKFFTLL